MPGDIIATLVYGTLPMWHSMSIHIVAFDCVIRVMGSGTWLNEEQPGPRGDMVAGLR